MFKPSDKQREALLLIAQKKHILLRGGSRSGKTFLNCRVIVTRASKAPGSRHVIFRNHFNAVKQTIGMDTMPNVLDVSELKYDLNKTDWVFVLPNGSEIWLAGLDDKERTEKILGFEFATIYMNEISQMNYDSVLIAKTRLSQKVYCSDGKILKTKMLYDCNPPSTKHWSYKQFFDRKDPVNHNEVGEEYGTMLMNPMDNIAYLAEDYLDELNKLPEAKRRRFLLGEFVDSNEGALWQPEQFRYTDPPRLVRIVVAIDPSGSKGGDEVGIIAVGKCQIGNLYVLSDRSGRYTPLQWATISVNELKALKGDAIVAERNYGGDMVKHTILSHDRFVKVIEVTASRGKDIRAEPVQSLYEQGRVFHAKGLNALENEMLTWCPGDNESPNRIDALVWAVTELMDKKDYKGATFHMPR